LTKINFEIVHSFAYLGSKVNRKNDVSAEIETAVSLQIDISIDFRSKDDTV
jgi:hypothetical protein